MPPTPRAKTNIVNHTTKLLAHGIVSRLYKLPTVGRFLVILSAGVIVAHALNLRYHNAYWNYTLFRVQTVDLNIYANLLPGSIKEALESGQSQKAERALSSNYGLFGVVVTKCSAPRAGAACLAERLFAINGFAVNDNGNTLMLRKLPLAKTSTSRGWPKQLIDLSGDREGFFDFLQSDPRVQKQGVYRDSDLPDFKYITPSDKSPVLLLSNNRSTRIGNIYMIRNTSASAEEEIRRSIGNLFTSPPSNLAEFISSSSGTYAATYLSLVLTFLLIWKIAELSRYQGILESKRAVEQAELLAQSRLDKQNLELAERQREQEQRQRELAESQREQEKQLRELAERQREQEQQQRELAESQREQANQQLEYFKIRYSSEAFSAELEKDFSTNLRTVSQRLLDLINELASKIRTDANNILHDIGKAPLMQGQDRLDSFISALVKSDVVKENEAGRLLAIAKRSYNQLQLVTRDLKDAANTTTRPVSIREIERRVLEQSTTTTSVLSNLIDLVPCASECFIYGNLWQIYSIVRNVLYNSKKAVEKKDTQLRLWNDHVDFKPLVKFSTCCRNGLVIVTIEDNGPGIADSDQLKDLYRWKGLDASQEDIGKASGNGSDIVANYLRINNGIARVSNKTNDQGQITGLMVRLEFPQYTQNTGV